MACLTEARVRAARPQEKAYKVFDSLGLYLKVETFGGRLWRFKYRYGNVEKLLSLGRYPDVSLERAREKRDEARRLLADGVDPAIKRKTEKLALRRMGYTGDQMSWHGFRTIASTCLNEQGFDPDLIELQLAHAERNRVRAAYNKAQRLADRRKMMQAWADYLDGLRSPEMKPPTDSGDADTIKMMRFERERRATSLSGWERMSLPRAANGPRRRLDN